MNIQRREHGGFVIKELVLLVFVVGAMIALGVWLVRTEQARTRDFIRIADIRQFQAGFELMFEDHHSYDSAAVNGCDTVGVLASQCNFSQYLSTASVLRDPRRFAYTVSRVPSNDGYEISFHLEVNHGQLKAGAHTLDQNGIH